MDQELIHEGFDLNQYRNNVIKGGFGSAVMEAYRRTITVQSDSQGLARPFPMAQSKNNINSVL